MTEPKRKLIIIASPKKNSMPSKNAIDSASLKSERAYTCAAHPNREAFCFCVKCGSMMCSDCEMTIGGRRYCESCVRNDDALCAMLQAEILHPRMPQPKQEMPAPQSLKDIPLAVKNLITDATMFFRTAKDAPLPLTLLIAYISVLPNTIYQFAFKLGELIPKDAQYDLVRELLGQLNTQTLVGMAFISSAMQIVLLDLLFWACIRVFTASKMTFAQAGSTLNFCLMPLIFSIFGSAFELPIVSFMALGLMIISATTATRASTNCSLLQGMGVMLSFIIFSSMTGIL